MDDPFTPQQSLMRETDFEVDSGQLEWLAGAVKLPLDEVSAAFRHLQEVGLVTLRPIHEGSPKRSIAVAAAAARQPLSPAEDAVVDFLLGTRREPGHPHVARTPGVCGGAPVIRGTGIAVEAVANYFYAGKGPGDVQRDYPHLSLEEILDALHYEMDRRRGRTMAPVP